jgi:hypothetical protein
MRTGHQKTARARELLFAFGDAKAKSRLEAGATRTADPSASLGMTPKAGSKSVDCASFEVQDERD